MDKKLIKEAKDLINEVDRTHRYSMSKIYGLTNKVFNRNEQPQSCASCLIRKVNELKKWLESQTGEEEPEFVEPEDSITRRDHKKTILNKIGEVATIDLKIADFCKIESISPRLRNAIKRLTMYGEFDNIKDITIKVLSERASAGAVVLSEYANFLKDNKDSNLSPDNLESVDLVEKASKPKRKRKEANNGI